MTEETKIHHDGAAIAAEALSEEEPTIDEEFRDLHAQAADQAERYAAIAKTLQASANEPVTKAHLADLYRFLSGDVSSLLKDLVSVTGAAFNDVLEELGGGEDDEGDGPSDETVQVYATLMANVEAFENLSKVAQLQDKEKLRAMATLNQTSLDTLDEQFGEEIKKLAMEYLSKASEVAAPDDDV